MQNQCCKQLDVGHPVVFFFSMETPFARATAVRFYSPLAVDCTSAETTQDAKIHQQHPSYMSTSQKLEVMQMKSFCTLRRKALECIH